MRQLQALYPENATYQHRLKDVQAKNEKWQQAESAKQQLAARRAYAHRAENILLDHNINVDVLIEGKEADVLRIKYVLASKVSAHQIEQTNFIDAAWALGFQKVILDNRYGETWTWTVPRAK